MHRAFYYLNTIAGKNEFSVLDDIFGNEHVQVVSELLILFCISLHGVYIFQDLVLVPYFNELGLNNKRMGNENDLILKFLNLKTRSGRLNKPRYLIDIVNDYDLDRRDKSPSGVYLILLYFKTNKQQANLDSMLNEKKVRSLSCIVWGHLMDCMLQTKKFMKLLQINNPNP